MRKILVSRFSALGDVTIAVHVLKAVLEQNKDIEILLLTNPFLIQLFKNIKRISFVNVDLKEKHTGIKGIKLLAKEITSEYEIDAFVDIHNVLRTKLLKTFLPSKIKTSTINKGRIEKKKATKKKNKKLKKLTHSAERYAQTFIKAGINVDLNNYESDFEHSASPELEKFKEKFQEKKIAIAPFAAHKTKMLPIEIMQEIIKKIPSDYSVFIFGGGKSENQIAEKWQSEFKNIYSMIGKFSMTDEISMIDSCDYTITMDSGNMHLASLTKTKIISVWGATHPYLGFSPFKKENTIYLQKDLACRPCSVFGNKKCFRDKMYCLDFDADEIIDKIKS
ncbi:MAG: glycosyltransferase family 9 protein [Bacteroidota bacterium]|nr:glycosyltransferase family 9 protein [Bacteroidota bacterium]